MLKRATYFRRFYYVKPLSRTTKTRLKYNTIIIKYNTQYMNTQHSGV